jgi:hypothetical protein
MMRSAYSYSASPASVRASWRLRLEKNLHGHRGLGDEQLLRGPGEAQVLGHVVEDLEVLEVEIEVHGSRLAA